MTVGNDEDVTKNAVCVALNTKTDGGWYPCPKSLTGKTFGVYSSIKILNFMEVMAYSQEAIQTNDGVTVSSIGTSEPNFIPSNALKNIVVAYVPRKKTAVRISSPSNSGIPTFGIKFKS